MNKDTKRNLIAHLTRRAGFGATFDELNDYMKFEYTDLVDHLLDRVDSNHTPDDVIYRRFPDLHATQGHFPAYWGYRLASTDNPLLEKVALLWHGIFATGETKLNNCGSLLNQINMFRTCGLSRFDDLLLQLSKDPAMLIWLDNHTNHKDAINENYGREILELFSMGVGNYSEDDIKECARAFTGWTVKNGEYMSLMGQKDSIWPYGRIQWHYEYREEDHDDGEKTFLGQTGNFDGGDIIKIICEQEATARFVSRHLYNFFVADEVPVPQWYITPARDEEAIEQLVKSYFEHDHDIKAMLRVLFNSDFFKTAMYKRVKSPVELVFGTIRKTGESITADEGDKVSAIINEAGFMGQTLIDPPSVEGWHTGEEWVTSGSLVDRVNFATTHITNEDAPGVRKMVHVIQDAISEDFRVDELIDECLLVIGPMDITDETRSDIKATIASERKRLLDGKEHSQDLIRKLSISIFRLLVSSREYQRC